MDKIIILQDSDELICDIKAANSSPIETLGFNQINHSKGVKTLHEGTMIDSYTPEDIATITNELIDERVSEILNNFDNQDYQIFHCLSVKNTFRKKVDLNYKKKENKKFNPFMNPDIRQHLIDKFQIYDKNNNPDGKILVGSDVEADDKIGIAATYFHKKIKAQGDNPIIVISSQDKDFKTIPNVWIYNHKTQEMTYNTYLDAIKFWLTQIMMGDRQDGVIGLKGYGHVSAVKFVDENIMSGVKSTYLKIKAIYKDKGRETDCLKNAILLRILTNDFYNTETQEPILFSEEHLDFLDNEFYSNVRIPRLPTKPIHR